MPRIADTSFLYAAFDAADARHEAARDELSKPDALHVPLCVMAEFLDLVAYRQGRKTALQVLDDLTRLPTVALVALRDEREVLAVWRANPNLSMVDAAGVQACLESGAALLSYDTKQAKALAAARQA